MCGIAGIFDTQGRAGLDQDLLRRMTDVQSHRGPDGRGQFVDGKIGLGHRRLSIIDLGGGAQPMASADKRHVVTFNGEIYNFLELKAELEAKGEHFETRSDTEVLLAAYKVWGEDCVRRLRGMFAFAIWDKSRETLFLARDRLGKKPLYYTRLGNGLFLFASELKGILCHDGVSRKLDERAVEDYFALGYVADPKTIYSAVRKLPAGHSLTVAVGAHDVQPRAYWDLRFDHSVTGSAEDIAQELRVRLKEAVRLRMISDVPLGAFLSGGVDSSAVVAMMSDLSSQPVKTCSIGFDTKAYDESAYAALVAERFHTDHFTRQVKADDFDLIDILAGVYDEPFADASALPTYRVCELARQRVTVALSGDGGDELFAGYRRQRLHMAEERIRSLIPRVLRRTLFGTLGRVYPKLDWAPQMFRARSTFQSLALTTADAYFNTVSAVVDDDRCRLFHPNFATALGGYHARDVMRHAMEGAPCEDALSLVQYADIKTYLVGDILTKVDRASMAHGLEVRAPILDHEFMEWAAGIPAALRLQGGEGKYIFKKALEGILPDDILYRTKMGFSSPISDWFRGPLQERMGRVLNSPRLLDSGIFNRDSLKTIEEEHLSGRRDHGRTLWSLTMFEASMRQLEKSERSEAA